MSGHTLKHLMVAVRSGYTASGCLDQGARGRLLTLLGVKGTNYLPGEAFGDSSSAWERFLCSDFALLPFGRAGMR